VAFVPVHERCVGRRGAEQHAADEGRGFSSSMALASASPNCGYTVASFGRSGSSSRAEPFVEERSHRGLGFGVGQQALRLLALRASAVLSVPWAAASNRALSGIERQKKVRKTRGRTSYGVSLATGAFERRRAVAQLPVVQKFRRLQHGFDHRSDRLVEVEHHVGAREFLNSAVRAARLSSVATGAPEGLRAEGRDEACYAGVFAAARVARQELRDVERLDDRFGGRRAACFASSVETRPARWNKKPFVEVERGMRRRDSS